MALNANALISQEEAETLLGVAWDEQIEFLINSASTQAENLTGRPLVAQDLEEVVEGVDGKILVHAYPINTITSIEYGTSPFDLQPIDTTYYFTSGILRIKDRLTGTFKVSYNGGYGLTFDEAYPNRPLLPSDLKQAVLEVVSYNLSRFSSRSFGIKSTLDGMGNIGTSYELTIPLSARKVFEAYRVPKC